MMYRMSLALVGAAALTAAMYSAALRGIADANYTDARLAMAASTAASRSARPEELSYALAAVRRAIEFEPSNPMFAEQAARLQQLRALGLPVRDPGVRDGLRRSLAQYREAAVMRPGSPYVWASIAMLKARLDAMDFEFYGALERAGRLGPWEAQVQVAMIDVGLATWPWLAKAGREWVLGALERGMLRQEAEIRRIAAVHGTLPQVCADATGRSPRIGALCVIK